MSANTNPLAYNDWVNNLGVLAVSLVNQVSGVNQFADSRMQTAIPMILNYAELRIQRDLDMQGLQTNKTYALTQGVNIFQIPVDDFLTVQTIEWTQGSPVAVATPLIPTSKEFIQNVYGGLQNAGPPKYYAMYGSDFGVGDDVNKNILIGPAPNYAYTIRVTGTVREISLFSYSDTQTHATTKYTYISAYYPDLLMMASMIYVSAIQRNFSATSDDPQAPMNYEKQYQALKTVAVMEENRLKLEGSGWSAYSTPVSATPTR